MAPRLRLLALALLAAGAVAAFVVLGLASSETAHGVRSAPALPREVLSGRRVTLSGLVPTGTHRAALVVFWASWCPPCEREAPADERFAKSSAGRGRIVGVDWSDALSGARAFVRRFGWTFSNLRDAEGAVGNAYRLTVLPTTFVLGPGAAIRQVLRGPQDQESLTRALASAERAG